MDMLTSVFGIKSCSLALNDCCVVMHLRHFVLNSISSEMCRPTVVETVPCSLVFGSSVSAGSSISILRVPPHLRCDVPTDGTQSGLSFL